MIYLQVQGIATSVTWLLYCMNPPGEGVLAAKRQRAPPLIHHLN